jgi:lipid-binding SYLF domain-containing protein
MQKAAITFLVLILASTLVAGCGSTAPSSANGRSALVRDAEATIQRFKMADAGLTRWFETAHAYAVFPSIGKGGMIVGGAYGKGVVFEKGEHIGFSDLSQATIGLQLGGQSYSEVIFFRDSFGLGLFKQGNYEVSAQASAVAATAGASADADYSGGVAIFTLAQGGLMAEAAIGGQKFRYQPK